MSLDFKSKGNPEWKPGVSGNPQGRPKGGTNRNSQRKIQDRLLGFWKTHPVDRLVRIANANEASNPELAAEIWTDLLHYFEPKKKPVESPVEKLTPQDSLENAAELQRQLEEIEQNGLSNPTPSDQETGLVPGPSSLPAKARAEDDLPGDKAE